jgi:hypothetical protein
MESISYLAFIETVCDMNKNMFVGMCSDLAFTVRFITVGSVREEHQYQLTCFKIAKNAFEKYMRSSGNSFLHSSFTH